MSIEDLDRELEELFTLKVREYAERELRELMAGARAKSCSASGRDERNLYSLIAESAGTVQQQWKDRIELEARKRFAQRWNEKLAQEAPRRCPSDC